MSLNTESNKRIFERYLPDAAVDYCFDLWMNGKFDFNITRSRHSKLGDYSFDPNTGRHRVTVNHDLNKYAFLITYIHEVAHKKTFDLHQNRVSPHGHEWKTQFKKLILPLLNKDVFPTDVLAPLAYHMRNPKASSVRDAALQTALNNHDQKPKGILLRDINIGQKFLFKKKTYLKLDTKRTRCLCEHINTGRRYLISQSAPVSAFKN